MSMEQPDSQDSGVVEQSAAEDQFEAEQHQDDVNQSSEDSQEQTGGEEEDELDIDGEKVALPKTLAEKLKAKMMMQSDYTRKTQEVAEQRKAVEAEREQVQRNAKAHQEYVQDIAKVVSIDEQLAEFQKVNWDQLIDQDPTTAMKLRHQQDALQQKRAAAAQSITQKEQQRALNEQQSIAKQVQEAEAFFKREIPGWSSERSDQLNTYASQQGLKGQQLAKAILEQPVLAKILHKAEQFDQLQKKLATKPKVETQEKPVTRISAARTTTQKDPDKMSMDEWVKWRESQRKKR